MDCCRFFFFFKVFGVGLCRLAVGGADPVPSAVTRLIQEIEQRAAATPNLDLYRLYRTTTPSGETIAQLCQQLASLCADQHQQQQQQQQQQPTANPAADLSAFEAHVLASGLKKLLRELPDPVIPSQWYDTFIEASRKSPPVCFHLLHFFIRRMHFHRSFNGIGEFSCL